MIELQSYCLRTLPIREIMNTSIYIFLKIRECILDYAIVVITEYGHHITGCGPYITGYEHHMTGYRPNV